MHWTDGALVDLEAVAARAHELGARLVIDGSQSVGAMPLDVTALRPDFVVTVGYKWLLGPFGVAYLWVADEHRDGEPIEENWILRAGSEDFARLVDYRDEYQPGARRFDVGQRTQFELVPMAIAALQQLTDWQVPRAAATLATHTGRIADRADLLGLGRCPPISAAHTSSASHCRPTPASGSSRSSRRPVATPPCEAGRCASPHTCMSPMRTWNGCSRPWSRLPRREYRVPVSSQRVPGGVVHKLPADLRKVLIANTTALDAWKDITSLASNEFICWVVDAKQDKTRERRIRRTQEELEEGQRRPCCWPGCKHRDRNGS